MTARVAVQGVATMRGRVLLGLGGFMVPVPRVLWQPLVHANGRKLRASLGFMSPEHQRVRDFTVTELARDAAPLTPEHIAASVGLPVTRVQAIVDELERRLTFIYRSRDGAVTWAYPITVDETPHRATLDTGEDAYSP